MRIIRCCHPYSNFLTDSLKAKERKACLQYMSYRDMLTTLYNRNRYIQVLEGMQAKQ